MKPKIKLLVFSGAHCGPCKMFKPIVDQFIKENDFIDLQEVCVTGNINEAKKYGVKAVPTCILYLDDKEVSRFTGIVSKLSLEKYLEASKVIDHIKD